MKEIQRECAHNTSGVCARCMKPFDSRVRSRFRSKLLHNMSKPLKFKVGSDNLEIVEFFINSGAKD